jgi:hypothetical protein
VRYLRDTLRASQIVVEAILRCNPVKVFLLLAAPFLGAACLAGMAALLLWSWSWLTIALTLLHTGVVVLALGFVAVALLPRPAWSDAWRNRPAGSAEAAAGNGSAPAATVARDA